MFERNFNRFFNSFTTRGCYAEGTFRASERTSCDNTARCENTVNLLSLGTVLAVSIFVALRLIVICLVSLISLVVVSIISIIRVIIGFTPPKRPVLASAN